MTLRVLIIHDEEVYRRLLGQHVSVGFPSPVIAEYDPTSQGRPPSDFHASGYDAVLLDDRPDQGAGLPWLRDLTGRDGFPPVIYLMSQASPADERDAKSAGAFACLSKSKVDNAELVKALRAAQAVRQRVPAGEAEDTEAAEANAGTGQFEHERSGRFSGMPIRGYACLRKIHSNPVSSVFLARRLVTGEEVALKMLRYRPEGAASLSDTFDRFLREYHIASAIRHPNVVRIFDFGADDDYAYIAMEYFPKGDLRTRIKDGIAPFEALRFMREIAQALQVLHEAGVLHRDLKPGNVMLREDDSLVLIDFGMSKQIQLEVSITESGQIFGTPYYMSPEQGHGRPTDERSDLYSLGIMFYEMLMRRKPYLAGTPMQVIYRHAHSPLPELPPRLKRFEEILYNCIAKDPVRRYSSAGVLVKEIKELELEEAQREAMGF